MPQDWIEVSIHTDIDAGELLGALSDPFVQGAWQDGHTIHLYWPSDRWSADHAAALRAVLQQFGGASAELLVQQVPDQDWNRQWAQSVRPIRIGRRIVIRPSWEPAALQADDIEIVLDPKQAFGTGHHATTRMLLEWLEALIHGGESVLDVGSGSGILAMVALRLGAASAVGVECDPVAVDCARDYARENGFGPESELVCGTLSDLAGRTRPDLVLANLDRQTLLALADDLASYGTAGARLLLSGVLVDQEAEVVERYSRFGLYVANRREQDGWVALELARPESCEGNSETMSRERPPYPHVHQINVSDGGVPKRPVLEAVIAKTGLEGDRQRNREVHGGPDRAVCLFSLELLERLQAEGHPIDAGSSGENLTLAGLEWDLIGPGAVISVGPDVQLEVTSYTAPCRHNAPWFLDGDYQRISQKKNPGWSRLYAKVLREGVVRPGDAVEIRS